MKTNSRRSFLQAGLTGLAGLASVPLLGSGLAGCAPTATRPTTAGSTSGASKAAPAPALTTEKLTERLTLISGVPGNVIALSSDDGVVLVDSGSAALAGAVKKNLGGAKVKTLFNTHYHADQTGGNALFHAAGAEVYSHKITRQWLETDFYVPADDRWVKAQPKAAWPTKTFREKGELKAGVETIEYGYLLEAHTRGDIYVFFRDS